VRTVLRQDENQIKARAAANAVSGKLNVHSFGPEMAGLRSPPSAGGIYSVGQSKPMGELRD